MVEVETDTHFSTRVLVGFRDAPGRHPAVRRAPDHRLDRGEVHQRPAVFRFGRVDEVRFKTGVVRGLFKTCKFFGAFVAQRDAERTDFMPIGLHVGLL